MCGNVGDLLKTFGSKGELFSFFIHSSRFSSAKFEQKGKYVVETNPKLISRFLFLGNLLDFSQAARYLRKHESVPARLQIFLSAYFDCSQGFTKFQKPSLESSQVAWKPN